MTLNKQHKMSQAKLATHRSSAQRRPRAVAPEGKTAIINLERTRYRGTARTSAVKLRHKPHSPPAAMASSSHEEEESQRRLDSLIAAWEPANALEMSLVVRLARQMTELLTQIKKHASEQKKMSKMKLGFKKLMNIMGDK